MAVYALLVGINAYQAVPHLFGAVSDIEHVEEFLQISVPKHDLHTKVLLDGEATRAAVIDAFRTHLTQAGPDDAALFWFSGHGSEAVVDERFIRSEPTRILQTILCVDSRQGDVPDLLDKELAILIAAVTRNGTHLTAVLDSCHSDGGTRRPVPGAVKRWADRRPIPPDHLLIPELSRPPLRGAEQADHVSLAACQSHEAAYEIPDDGGHRGVFSLMLLKQLAESGLPYHELLARTQAMVEAVRPQVPVMFPKIGPLTEAAFLGGQAAPSEPTMMMRLRRDGWYVNAGSCHGLTAGTDDDPMLLGLRDDEQSRQVRVVQVAPGRSRVEPVDWTPEDNEEHFAVVVTRIPIPPAKVLIGGRAGTADAPETPDGTDTPATEDELRMLALVTDTVRIVGPEGGPSIHLEVLEKPDENTMAELRVTALPDDRVLIEDFAREAQDIPLPCRNQNEAWQVVKHLEHITRWRRMWTLVSPQSRLAGKIAIDVVPAEPGEERDPMGRDPVSADDTGAVRISYRKVGNFWLPPHGVFIRLRNLTDKPLYCVLLDMTDRYRIHPSLFPGGWIAPGTTYVQAGWRVDLCLPDDESPVPGARVIDWLKVIASEEALGLRNYVLPRLGDKTTTDSLSRGDILSRPPIPGVDTVADRLGFEPLRDRDAVIGPRTAEWTTAMVKVITSVPDADAESEA